AVVQPILTAERSFVTLVVNTEYPAMQHLHYDSKTQASQATQEALSQMSRSISTIIPHTLHEQTLYAEILKNTNEMAKYRSQRLVAAHTELPEVMWLTIVLGGLITIGFTTLFGGESLWLQLVMTGLLSLVIGFVVYVIVQMNHPFVGTIRV